MAYLVTARKWRPQRFNEVVGQEHVTTTLKNAIKNNRIAHAYMLTGPRGVGKTTTARILAKAVNCLHPVDYEPCGECEICQSIQNNQLIDIIEIDGASNRGIDEIKNLRESVKYAPAKAKYKIYIIDEVHMLTRESFNAFLKTLEEPPDNVIFIFATTDIHKVPLTIISRCQRYDFRRIQLDTIKEQLSKIAKEDGIEIDDKVLTIIGKKADGALRDAESFFDQIVSFCDDKVDYETVSKMLNLIDEEIYFDISDSIFNKNYQVVFDATNKLYENGWNFVEFIDGLIFHFRNILTVIVTQNTNLIESANIYKNRYLEYRNKFSEGDILRILNFLNKSSQELKYSQNQKIKIEIALTQLIGFERAETISKLIEMVNSNAITHSIAENNIKYNSPAPEKINHDAPNAPAPKIELPGNNNANNLNLESAVSKWKRFVDIVNNEKGLLGEAVKALEFLSIDGNRVNLKLKEQYHEITISAYEDYLAKKLSETFNKKLSYKIVHDDIPEEEIEVGDLNPIKNFITKDMGGRKIN